MGNINFSCGTAMLLLMLFFNLLIQDSQVCSYYYNVNWSNFLVRLTRHFVVLKLNK